MAVTVPSEEQEFSARLDELEHDARAAARFTYAAATLDHLRSRRPSLSAALERDADFWDTVLGALQTASVAAVARVYDPRSEVVSADRVLKHAIAHAPTLFSRPALQARLARRLPVREAAEESLSAHEPTVADFAALRASLDRHGALYASAIGPIRHELFTELDGSFLMDTLALFQTVQRADFERLALFPLSLHGALRRLFHDGRKPEPEIPPSDIARLIADPMHARDGGAWEQSYMVRDAWRFLTGLERTDAAEEKRGPEFGED
jgi:hypothetical protein